jgi:hypothetical protein
MNWDKWFHPAAAETQAEAEQWAEQAYAELLAQPEWPSDVRMAPEAGQ